MSKFCSKNPNDLRLPVDDAPHRIEPVIFQDTGCYVRGGRRLQVVFDCSKRPLVIERLACNSPIPHGRYMTRNSRGPDHAFTLIEMIGVLAVIAVLAALLIPKIFESINSARLNQT